MVAPPSPGKCFAVAATPPARQPSTAAFVAAAAVAGSVENARPAIADPLPVGTSATGARATLSPCALSAWAAAFASRPGTCRACPTAGGAHSIRRMSPPSWSVEMIGVASGLARRSERVSRLS